MDSIGIPIDEDGMRDVGRTIVQAASGIKVLRMTI
jgi:hypothetical protein